jgi:hypothetical protein
MRLEVPTGNHISDDLQAATILLATAAYLVFW